jgi:uncharacterized membrane protein
VVGVEVSESTVVVMADDSETTVEGRSGVGITYRRHDDFNGAVLVGPLPLVMSEDEDDEAVMKIVESVPVGGNNVVREDVSIFAELGDKGSKRAVVRVGANVEDRVRSCNTYAHTYCCVNRTNV